MARTIIKERVFEKVGYERHEGQRRIHKATERFRAAAWGRRAGKSRAGGMELVPPAYLAYMQRDKLAARGQRHEYWIVGPEYSDAEKEFRVVYDSLKRLDMPFDRPGTYNDPIGGNMHISLWGGLYQVHGRSAKYPTTLVGEGLRGLVLSEAAKIKEIVWQKYLRPTLADYGGWLYAGSTPEGKNWFYRLWQLGQDPSQEEYWSLRAPAWINPYVYPGGADDPEVRSLRNSMSTELFNQEIAALFTEFVGRVFKDFDEEIHVKPQRYDPALQTFAAVDYGYTNPNVWLLLQVERWGTVRVIDEYYERNRTIDEMAADLQNRGLTSGVRMFFPDPASPGDSTQLSKLLRIPFSKNTGGELKDRLELIRQALFRQPRHLDDDHPEKQPKLFVDPRCKNTIYELNEYRYPETRAEDRNAPELPLKRDDHTPEALGRFFRGYFGMPARTNAKLRTADVRG